MINADVSVKKHHVCKKDYIWDPATYSCQDGKYLATIMDNSAIISDEIINVNAKAKSKNKETNFNEKNITCKTQNFYFTGFLVITIILLVAVIIYCYLIKH